MVRTAPLSASRHDVVGVQTWLSPIETRAVNRDGNQRLGRFVCETRKYFVVGEGVDASARNEKPLSGEEVTETAARLSANSTVTAHTFVNPIELTLLSIVFKCVLVDACNCLQAWKRK